MVCCDWICWCKGSSLGVGIGSFFSLLDLGCWGILLVL